MNFPLFLILVLFCSLTSAQVEGQTTNKSDLQLCSPEVSDLLKEIGALRENQGAMERRLKESENQIAELKRKGTTRVAFSAVSGGGLPGHAIGPLSQDQTFIFKKELTNIGSAYNSGTGIFAAPFTGLYYFGFFHHAGGAHTASLSLIKNNEQIVMTYDHASTADTADNGGNAVLLELQQGDQVYVRLNANSHIWSNDVITTFSGFLLSQE